jgi:purine-nucleoside phosphorylase
MAGRLEACVAAVRAKAPAAAPKVGIILGSGLGDFATALQDPTVIPYADLPSFPLSGVQGHAGRLVLGTLDGQGVVAMQGRVHYYEGYSPQDVAFPARVLSALGIKGLVVTNAAGGINSAFQVGDLMAITDHINLAGYNPLIGPNDPKLGPRFPDMSHAYDPKLLALLEQCAIQAGVPLRKGVYCCLAGPSYETPAEIRMLRTLGADAVGMSTVPEVIAAAHMGVKVAGISCITNLAAGLGAHPLSHSEVADVAARVRGVFTRLLERFLPELARS